MGSVPKKDDSGAGGILPVVFPDLSALCVSDQARGWLFGGELGMIVLSPIHPRTLLSSFLTPPGGFSLVVCDLFRVNSRGSLSQVPYH